MGHSQSKSPDMGRSQSKPEPPVFEKPWRRIEWGKISEDLEFVRNYKPEFEGQKLRILLHGPEAAGKSSFINSVQSVLKGRIYSQALADNCSCSSFTKEYTTYKIVREDRSFCPFVFCDIMGLSERGGVLEEDIKLALKGHVKEGYKFNPASQLPESHESYQKNPTPNDTVHVLVCIIPADNLDLMSDEVVGKIRRIREDARDHYISQIAILTKIDQVCPELKEDLKKVYILPHLKRKIEKFSATVGIPMSNIFPVKNYHEEIDLDDDINALILSAMKHIINSGDDCINFHHNRFESS
ncbi:interferon-induced protein 44-like [Xiphophorus hellerii]|uniref:interferon-induced protein 44-like n=1 Tax=Xiphophorus hellerii TaxID=8084 RepID=UPI0013B41AC0|nr:interferon-induced protein 44-like [Xiphophorus hellerii]